MHKQINLKRGLAGWFTCSVRPLLFFSSFSFSLSFAVSFRSTLASLIFYCSPLWQARELHDDDDDDDQPRRCITSGSANRTLARARAFSLCAAGQRAAAAQMTPDTDCVGHSAVRHTDAGAGRQLLLL